MDVKILFTSHRASVTISEFKNEAYQDIRYLFCIALLLEIF